MEKAAISNSAPANQGEVNQRLKPGEIKILSGKQIEMNIITKILSALLLYSCRCHSNRVCEGLGNILRCLLLLTVQSNFFVNEWHFHFT